MSFKRASADQAERHSKGISMDIPTHFIHRRAFGITRDRFDNNQSGHSPYLSPAKQTNKQYVKL
jgi:hypothetical protein